MLAALRHIFTASPAHGCNGVVVPCRGAALGWWWARVEGCHGVHTCICFPAVLPVSRVVWVAVRQAVMPTAAAPCNLCHCAWGQGQHTENWQHPPHEQRPAASYASSWLAGVQLPPPVLLCAGRLRTYPSHTQKKRTTTALLPPSSPTHSHPVPYPGAAGAPRTAPWGCPPGRRPRGALHQEGKAEAGSPSTLPTLPVLTSL